MANASTVYHYCGADSFLSILRNGCLWVSDARKTNDRRELEWFKELALKRIAKLAAKGDKMFGDLHLALRVRFELIEDVSDYYVCCFSEKKDSVPQWVAYADRGTGFAIGFDVNILREKISAALLSPNYSLVPSGASADGWSFGPVVYAEEGRDNAQIEDLISLVVSAPFIDQDSADTARDYIDRVCAFCKHSDFDTEHEWRIVCNTSHLRKAAGLSGNNMLPDTKWRKGAYGLTPYRETVNVLDCIKEVIVGPGNADRDSIEYVKQFLRFSGIDAKVFPSASPYR
ncbi:MULTISPECIES: DUF2971 domain-containing protein [Paraburkholderia]|uniref:DUF2971 domain-containing protein n=1 Tax=Paraburkholderia TaxID=1822464 RepID=UPI00225B221E|nr:MULTISPECIES: DUF2971 domain-containing protein [Paraburkholderia]